MIVKMAEKNYKKAFQENAMKRADKASAPFVTEIENLKKLQANENRWSKYHGEMASDPNYSPEFRSHHQRIANIYTDQENSLMRQVKHKRETLNAFSQNKRGEEAAKAVGRSEKYEKLVQHIKKRNLKRGLIGAGIAAAAVGTGLAIKHFKNKEK